MSTKDEILEIVTELCEMYPTMRFGQILENYAFGPHNQRCCIFHFEDKEVLKNLKDSCEWINKKDGSARWP
jgi:hypothetical protein